MWGKLWKLYILDNMAQVPPKATLMVAVEQLVLYYLALHLI